MNQSSISVRYAKAIFELAKEKDSLKKVYEDFRLVRDVLLELPEFNELMASPIVKKSDKTNLFVNTFSGKIDEMSLNFLKFLVEKNREMYIIDIFRNFEASYRKANNVKQVVISTVEPLNEETRRSIQEKIAEVYKANVELENVINKDMIGGVIVRIENQQLDMSVRTQLKEIK
ncbi:MAG: ATP synthase F1 subunit delta, partial [Bacteroidales bacterium]|nr:ATP synthase F1 subunit delta [Bacteroidales bacterium]